MGANRLSSPDLDLDSDLDLDLATELAAPSRPARRPSEGGVNRQALNVLIAALDLEQRELADEMGYENGYIKNVFNNFTPPSDAFKRAFGDVIADLLLGKFRVEAKGLLPAGPLADLLRKRAESAPCRTDFYRDLGLTSMGWGNRRFVTEELVDRVCCALGVHPTSLYGNDYNLEDAS
jgi:hypothetical protein